MCERKLKYVWNRKYGFYLFVCYLPVFSQCIDFYKLFPIQRFVVVAWYPFFCCLAFFFYIIGTFFFFSVRNYALSITMHYLV